MFELWKTIKRDGMERVLIKGKQTFTKTYKFESEIFKKHFGLFHLNLRDVLTYANFLGDDEYSGRIDKICNKLNHLFSDKENVERNCLFWYNPKWQRKLA